jgi:hypothetical protein
MLSEKGNAFLRALKNKGFKEERVTTVRLDDLGKTTTLEYNKSLQARYVRVTISRRAIHASGHSP